MQMSCIDFGKISYARRNSWETAWSHKLVGVYAECMFNRKLDYLRRNYRFQYELRARVGRLQTS